MIPLMILAAVIATVPILHWSVREHRELHVGSPPGQSADAAVAGLVPAIAVVPAADERAAKIRAGTPGQLGGTSSASWGTTRSPSWRA